jgi:hypothetical protein
VRGPRRRRAGAFFFSARLLLSRCAAPTPPPHTALCRELWALADFLTALAETDDVREGLGMWAAGTYRNAQSLRRRERAATTSSDEDD